jgi:hypothetical protein
LTTTTDGEEKEQAGHSIPLCARFSAHILQVLRPWCWYCEREFEDEKGLCVF